MIPASLPENEADRLKALAEYHLLDTLPEEVYDDITRIATELTGTPTALINLVDAARQWTKSKYGSDLTELPREQAFCAHTILDPDEMMIVEDARIDERFHDNPLTINEPKIIFYAGVPIVTEQGHALGALCVVDNRPRNLPDNKLMALKALAKLVNTHFELRKTRKELEQAKAQLQEGHQVESASHVVPAQAERMVDQILANVAGLVANGTPSEQTAHLNSLQEAAQALKTTLQTQR